MGTFVAQLDGSPHAGDNCGPASLASALRWSTRHVMAPTPSLVRRRMKDMSGGVRPDQLEPAWETFRAGAKRRGWSLARMRYREHGEWEQLERLLSEGDAAQVAVDYSVIPVQLRGDPLYEGMHSVFVAGIGVYDGTRSARVFDPLCDGRRPGIPGPGAVYWSPALLRRAAAAYSGAEGRSTWNAVSRSERIGKPTTCSLELARVEEELEATQDALAAARRALLNIADTASAAAGIRETADMIGTLLHIGDPNSGSTGGFERV